MKEYKPKEIEARWQKIWDDNSDAWRADDNSQKPKFYSLFEFPYPSGEGLHMGHLRGQTAVDVYARKKRLEGFNVMTPIGWDAFGLPTENYAIRNKIQPAVATARNIASITKQEKMLGYFLDWNREIKTTDPKYYRWTQWIFLKLLEHGLAYKALLPINWCPSCLIGLANEEVIDGKCERCGADTEKRMVSQWLLRITKYADKLLKGLETIDFPDRVKTQQINWIGRSEGTSIKFKVESIKSGTKESVEVFTTRADTLFGTTYMVLAPEHELILKIKNKILNIKEVEDYTKAVKQKSDIERTDQGKVKTGVELKGIYAINPINNEKVPVWIADYVLLSYGTGAVMAVPAHDERDFEFAKKYKLPISEVVYPPYTSNESSSEKFSGSSRSARTILNQAFTDYGTLSNSAEFDGLDSKTAIQKITEQLKKNGNGDKTINYKLRDWIFSRQHYWGEPIPVVHCETCGIVPVPEDQLPVLLPEVEHYEPSKTGESPLAKMTDWVNTTCPKCGGPAKRETDTMPNWAGSSWYFLRYIDPSNDKEFANLDKLKYWLPVDLYEGGMEHTTLHLLYSRFWNEFLYDIGVVPVSEPFSKRVPHGMILASDGQKMSKSRGNIVKPDELVSKYGADTTRTFAMFIGPFDQTISWDDKGILGVWRFLSKVWKNMQKPNGPVDKSLQSHLQKLIPEVSTDIETFSMNTAVAKLMEFNNLLSKQKQIADTLKIDFLKLLYPYSPHISEELNSKINNLPIYKSNWPKVDQTKIIDDTITVVLQINSKNKVEIIVDKDLADEKLVNLAKADSKITSLIRGKKIIKTFVVKNRLVNFVTEPERD